MTTTTIVDLPRRATTLGICRRRLVVPLVLLLCSCSLRSFSLLSITTLLFGPPPNPNNPNPNRPPAGFAAASAAVGDRDTGTAADTPPPRSTDEKTTTTSVHDDGIDDDAGADADDDGDKCRIYLAPSSYVENHLAAYAGVDIAPGELIGRSSETGVPLVDFWLHNTRLPLETSLSGPDGGGAGGGSGGVGGEGGGEEEEEEVYNDEGAFDLLWTSDELVSQFEDMADPDDGVVIIPGLGVLGTHHPGIVNAAWDHAAVLNRFRPSGASRGVGSSGLLDRRRDAGAGAMSEFFGATPRATTGERRIHAGTEIFMDYGDEWVEVTEAGYTDPTSLRRANFARADHVLRNYTQFVSKYPSMFPTEKDRQALWDIIISDVVSNPITKSLLPKNVTEAERVADIGSGIANNPNSMRTSQWLEENGLCMDGLVGGKSTVEGAGRGAFAARFIPRGGLVAPGPMLRFYRDQLRVYEIEARGGGAVGAGADTAGGTTVNATDGGAEEASGGPSATAEEEHSPKTTPTGKRKRMGKVVGRQLVLNYCFGHRDSSLLLFPYSTGVNLINHNGEPGGANVEMRWSTKSKFHRGGWLRMSLSELGREGDEEHPPAEGLMMDFVATRDINPGEEVFLNYGAEWEEAWDDHVRRWSPPHPEGEAGRNYASASVLNEENAPFRTVEEQELDPYPSDVDIVCSCPKDVVTAMDEDDGVKKSGGAPKERRVQNETTAPPTEESEDDGTMGPIGNNANGADDDDTTGGGGSSANHDGGGPIPAWQETLPLVEYPCTILEREEPTSGEQQQPRYLVRIVAIDKEPTDDEEKKEKEEKRPLLLRDVPHSHVLFVDRPYRSAIHDRGAFRHYIPIPDEMFPVYWMDRKGVEDLK